MTTPLTVATVTVRDLAANDVPRVLDYWFRSPPGAVAAMGADPHKMPTEEALASSLRQKLDDEAVRRSAGLPSQLNALVVCVDGVGVGFHTINPLVPGKDGVFHAHVWDRGLRGRGIGRQSYPLACRVFVERFDLQRVLFKTPVQNVAAIRVKERLGIRCLGDEVIGFGLIKDGTRARVFELTRDEALRLAP